VPQGAELVQGAAADPGFCARATTGASVVYHCFSPPYDAKVWAALLPRFMDNLIAAAARAGARATLGLASDDETGIAWILPCAPARTLSELVHGFAETLGRPIRIARVPRMLVKALALFNPLVREVEEML